MQAARRASSGPGLHHASGQRLLGTSSLNACCLCRYAAEAALGGWSTSAGCHAQKFRAGKLACVAPACTDIAGWHALTAWRVWWGPLRLAVARTIELSPDYLCAPQVQEVPAITECPLCIETLDSTDLNFQPCPCGCARGALGVQGLRRLEGVCRDRARKDCHQHPRLMWPTGARTCSQVPGVPVLLPPAGGRVQCAVPRVPPHVWLSWRG